MNVTYRTLTGEQSTATLDGSYLAKLQTAVDRITGKPLLLQWGTDGWAETDPPPPASHTDNPNVPHHYTSTACHHSQHDYCNNTTGQAGPKTPATCKWCPAKCECGCHG